MGQHTAVALAIRSDFDGTDRFITQPGLKMIVAEQSAPATKLAARMEENLTQGLAVFPFPRKKQRRLGTTHPVERVNQELKRPTHLVGLFSQRSRPGAPRQGHPGLDQ